MLNRIMLFSNPCMKTGINLTVRRGTKWDGEKGVVEFGKSVSTSHTQILGHIRISNTQVFSFRDIPDTYLEFEHDKNCENKNDLFQIMNEVYTDFRWNEIVTLVWFEEE